MLTNELFEKHAKAKENLGIIETKINDRVGEILALICKAFNKESLKFSWAYHHSEDEGGGMHIDFSFSDDEIPICWWFHNHNGTPKLENRFWDYTQGFPGEFLKMSNDEILNHLKNEIKSSNEYKAAQKSKEKDTIELKKKKKKELLNKISEILDDEEKKLLKITIE